MKAFEIVGVGGERLACEQLATFAEYVQGEQFRFVVLRRPDTHEINVTHRESTKRVAVISGLVDRLGVDWVAVGRDEIQKLVTKHGAPKVRSVLAGA